jgi:hypothetical protein
MKTSVLRNKQKKRARRKIKKKEELITIGNNIKRNSTIRENTIEAFIGRHSHIYVFFRGALF